MSEITILIDWLLNVISENLYLGVFLAALVETIFPPIPSELVFPLAGYTILQTNLEPWHIITVGIVGGCGATVGSTVFYFISKYLGRVGILRYGKRLGIKSSSIDKSDKWFAKYGDKSVLLGRLVPGIRELVSIPAGIFSMKFPKFLLYTLIGSISWSMILTFLGYYFGVATVDLFSI